MAFSDNLAALMAKHNESNYRLAKEIGVAQTSVANWLSGDNKPLSVYVEKIASHYDVTADELLKGGEANDS